jgi:hypothetical protein
VKKKVVAVLVGKGEKCAVFSSLASAPLHVWRGEARPKSVGLCECEEHQAATVLESQAGPCPPARGRPLGAVHCSCECDTLGTERVIGRVRWGAGAG